MKADLWQQVKEVLDQALAFPSSERSAYLDQACRGNATLRAEVESLIRSHEDAGSVFLNNPAVDLSSVVHDIGRKLDRIGHRIGVYEIQEEIGHGGMGEVYRAIRADGQYQKQVAIKIVRVGFDTDFVLDRFRHERQILASLDHPNIARLYDGGTTEDGVPYLVMELIDGSPIDQYLDIHGLSVSERLLLFNQVCAAVEYAHRRLVIHRDIKPSNILVTAEGVPKLLDFGIAKILDPSGGAETKLVVPMTPEYASPEQIRGESITTATDVYSLGILLYRLLTGRSPYPAKTRTPLEFAKVICEAEPARPSMVPMNLTGDGSEIPHRKTPADSVKLKRALRGDLDNIVLKALRKEPERRYLSVEQFAEDIRRHLKGLPVAATKGSARYRVGKFVRRNRIALAVGAVFAMTLVVGVVATIRQARIARRQADIARTERARAEKRFNDVRELANSLIFEIHDSIQSLPGATPSRKLLLDRAVQYLDKLSQDSAGDVNLQRELAWAYHRLATVQGDTSQSNLGEVGAAEISNQKAMALFEAVASANPESVTDQLNLAMAYRGRAFFDIYETSGLSETNRALAITEPLMRKNPANLDIKNELAQETFILAYVQDVMGDRLPAIDSFRKVLSLQQEILDSNPEYPDIRHQVAKSMVLLAHQMGRFGTRDEALRLMGMGIAGYQALVKATGGDPAMVRELSTAEERRGEVELMRGDVRAARSDFHDAQLRISALAKLDPQNKMLQSDLWAAQFHDGRALLVAGRNAEAMSVLEGSFQGYRALHLEAEVWPGSPLMDAWIGEAQSRAHNFDKALKSYEAAAAILLEDEPHFDDARCDLAMVETKIGNTFLKLGKPGEAGAHFQKALDIAKLSDSLKHNDFPSLTAAAEAYQGMGDLAASEAQNTLRGSAVSKLKKDACSSYENSLNVWKHIPEPARINGNGYLLSNPLVVAQRLADCNSAGVSPAN